MSVSANRELSFLEILSKSLSGITFKHSSGALHHDDVDTCRNAFALWLCLIGDLLSQLPNPVREYQRILPRIVAEVRIKGIVIDDLCADLALIDENIIDCASHHKSVGCFKRTLKSITLCNSWLRGVSSDMIASFSSDLIIWRSLHQVCRFLQRITLRHCDALEVKTRDKYLDNLIRVAFHHDTTEDEVPIITDWLSGFAMPTIGDCQFGSGATSLQNVKSLSEKYAQLVDTARTRILANALGISPTAEIAVRKPLARLVFVPKSVKIKRPIAAEDPMLMFYQQGLLRSLDHMFRSTPLRRRIDLHDQSRSRARALVGSTRPDKFCTIDLSSASDSVRMELVEKWFHNTPISKILRLARSTETAINGYRILFPMFASMGSALCFPIECLCFAAMCEATIISCGDDPSYSDYCVYGDDIIIEQRYVEALIERLTYNGFLVNKEKSYYATDCYFRESCGGEYLDGYDVTPMYIPRNFSMSKKDRLKMMSSSIVMVNSAYGRNYRLMRLYILHNIIDFDVVFSDDLSLIEDVESEQNEHWYDTSAKGSFVFSPTATNYRLKRRWNSRLFKSEVLMPVVTAVERQPKENTDSQRYIYTLHKPPVLKSGCEPVATARVVGRTRLTLRKSWRGVI